MKDKNLHIRVDDKILNDIKYLQEYYHFSISSLIIYLIEKEIRQLS